jgi:biotin carboxyl carrier protein
MMDGLRVVVAPVTGRIRLLPPQGFKGGRELLGVGQAVAVIDGGGDETTVTVPVDGVLDGLLVHEGEPVRTGQALFVVRLAS